MKPAEFPEASVAILAGGQSRRMGQNKSFVSLAGRPVFEHTLERVTRLALPIQVITNEPALYASYGLPMFSDVLPGNGSLGGLFTALAHSPTAWTLVVACDMPFVNPALLAMLLEQRTDCEAIVPVINGRPQVLHAVYHRRCLTAIRHALDIGDLKIQRLVTEIRSTTVAESLVRKLDPELHSFLNLNTPADLEAARNLLPQHTTT